MRTKVGLLAITSLWALLVSPLRGRLAHAETGNREIDRGVALYQDLEFERAADALEKALRRDGLTRQELTEGHKYLALCHVALDRKEDARAAFRKLLEVDPGYQLPRGENPVAIELFEEVRRSRPPPPEAIRVTSMSTTRVPRHGHALTLLIAVFDEEKRHAKVVVHHRLKGQRGYSSVKAQQDDAGRYTAVLSGAFVEPPAIEYYVVAQGPGDEVLATAGTAAEPLLVLVEKKEGPRPIYAKWWFWGLVGTGLAAATVGIVLVTRPGDDAGGNSIVNVTVPPVP